MTHLEDALVDRLRAAGCVFAEEEAELLRERAADADELESLARRRIDGGSLEQLIGWVDFGGLRLAVGPGVFVPRQRSVLLAEATVAALRTAPGSTPVLVEAYAGVAPLSATVRRALPQVRLHAVDVDPVALEYAAANLGPEAQLHRGSGLSPLPPVLHGAVSVVTAVPPYVPDAAVALMPREAREHEAPDALSGGADGLDHVRTLLTDAQPWLSPGGRVLVELAVEQWDPAAAEAEAFGYSVTRPRAGDEDTAVLEVIRGP